MVKCRDVIKRTVGDAGRQYCVTVVEKAIKEMAMEKMLREQPVEVYLSD